MPVITFVFDDAAKQEVRLVEHEGLVLSTYEKNGYHDSDFYAVIWNPVKKTAESVMYATTSYGSYGNHAIIDASPDLIKTAKEWQSREWAEHKAEGESKFSAIPKIGSLVQVKVTRGKNKSVNGKVGKVVWEGAGFGYHSSPRAGVEIDGNRHFFSVDNLYLVDDEGVVSNKSWSDAILSYEVWKTVPRFFFSV
jgi:hypothetical protein